MKIRAAALALSMFSMQLPAADSVSVPEVVSKGLNSLKYSGATSALDSWLAGSPVERDAAERSNILSVLARAEGLYGKCIGSEIIQLNPITPSTLRIYGVILFEKGPLYARWDCYRASGGWIISQLKVEAVADKVLPPEMLFRR